MENSNFVLPVHRSLMEKNQLFGIGEKAFFGILMITVILASMISVYCIGLGILAILVCKVICKQEPLLIDFIFENINQPDVYRG